MGQKENLIKRLKSKPKDFTFEEAETLLNYFDYVLQIKAEQAARASSLPIKIKLQYYYTNLTHAKNCLLTR